LCRYDEDCEVHPQDILLLMNLVHSSKGIRDSESWIPVCLPGIGKDGFIYVYIYFIEKDIGIIFLSLKQDGV